MIQGIEISMATTEGYKPGDDIFLWGREYRILEVIDANRLLVYLRA